MVRMGEDNILRADLSTLETVEAQTLLLDYVVSTAFVLEETIGRADLDTIATLGAGSHLEDIGLGKLGFDGQSGLFRVVLAVGTILALGGLAPDGRTSVEQGTGQETSPASRTFRTICMKVHNSSPLSSAHYSIARRLSPGSSGFGLPLLGY